MPDQDDRMPADLREYYRQLERQPAPDVTGRVLMATDARRRRLRRWGAVGAGLLATGGAAAVIVLALANHRAAVSVAPASTAPVSTAGPLASPTTAPVSTPAQAVPVGAPAHGFVPTDVTAVSAGQWWVLGYDGPRCSSPACTRILHTDDGGHTFTSVPVPPVTPAGSGQQADRLRFDDPANGWVVSATGAVWATHDGGAHWAQDTGGGSVTDLEASTGTVYAVACAGGSNCTVERSPAGQDTWSTLPAAAGHGSLGRLNVNGSHVWVAVWSPAGGPGTMLASIDGGQHFSTRTVCPSALGFANLYAVDSAVLWATCATGMEASAFRSNDGGQHFTAVPAPSLPNFASIAGVSSTTAVVGSQGLLRTADGGQTFATVENGQTQWTVVGFTTSSDGFAFALQPSGQSALWRTDDAGAQWYLVQFP
jgi:photosystem II stability/assembly factor-like uncharacterized protein